MPTSGRRVTTTTIKPTVFLSATLLKKDKTIPSTLFPFSLPYSGSVKKDNGATYAQGADGRQWTASAADEFNGRALFSHSDFIQTHAYGGKGNGFPVRYIIQKNNSLHFIPILASVLRINRPPYWPQYYFSGLIWSLLGWWRQL